MHWKPQVNASPWSPNRTLLLFLLSVGTQVTQVLCTLRTVNCLHRCILHQCMLGATCRHRHLPACSAAVPLHCDLGATMRRPRLALGAAVALLMVFGASCVTTSKQQTSACEVAGYQYRRAQLPISSSDTFVVALGPPADIRRSPLELSAACEADPSCVMFTTTGFLLTVDWGTGGLSSPVATRRSSPGGGQTNTATEWTPGEALTNLRAASGVIWAPKHCASQDACCGTYVAAAAAAQLDTMSTATSTPRQALPTIAEDLAASQRVRPYPSTCTSTKLSHVDRRPVQLQPPIMPNPTPLGECSAALLCVLPSVGTDWALPACVTLCVDHVLPLLLLFAHVLCRARSCYSMHACGCPPCWWW